jgi:hypothetical protein
MTNQSNFGAISTTTWRYLYGCSVQFDSVEMLAFRPRARAKRPLPQPFGNCARHFHRPRLAKN